jgi:hypothetical protein
MLAALQYRRYVIEIAETVVPFRHCKKGSLTQIKLPTPTQHDLTEFFKTLNDGDVVTLVNNDRWNKFVITDYGFLTTYAQRGGWIVNEGLMDVEQLKLPVPENEGRPLGRPKHYPCIDKQGKLNGEILIPFIWKQFEGHPLGAVFQLENDTIVLLVHRPRVQEKEETEAA